MTIRPWPDADLTVSRLYKINLCFFCKLPSLEYSVKEAHNGLRHSFDLLTSLFSSKVEAPSLQFNPHFRASRTHGLWRGIIAPPSILCQLSQRLPHEARVVWIAAYSKLLNFAEFKYMLQLNSEHSAFSKSVLRQPMQAACLLLIEKFFLAPHQSLREYTNGSLRGPR